MHQPLHVKVNEKQRFVCLGNILHHKVLELRFHLILKIKPFPLFHIHTLHELHPKSLSIDVYCRTSALITSKLNLLIVLATILHSNVHGEVHSIQHYVKKFVSGFLRVLRPFHPPIKLTTTI